MSVEIALVEVDIRGTVAQLLPQRALWLSAAETLVISDLHFGKVNHFRRAGLPVPLAAGHRNAERLIDLLNTYQPKRTLFLGDLFHSAYNDDWEVIGQIVRHFPGCVFELVCGNHDILSEQQYRRHGIAICEEVLVDNLLLTHEPMDRHRVPNGRTNVAGHIHPAARLVGKGRQSLVMPCFWLTENQMIVPAFGTFTGLCVIYPDEQDAVYMIVDNRVMERRPTIT